MDAQLVSGVSDGTSPTRRESPVQFKQELVIAFVRRTDGLQILASDRTFPADHLFRPFRDGAPNSFEPDVREHPRPAAVAVEEGVDLDREMMEASRLFDQRVCPSGCRRSNSRVHAFLASSATWAAKSAFVIASMIGRVLDPGLAAFRMPQECWPAPLARLSKRAISSFI
jgi:hypothetical protein